MLLRSGGGARTLEAEKFFAGPMATSVRPGECLEEIHWPALVLATHGVRFHRNLRAPRRLRNGRRRSAGSDRRRRTLRARGIRAGRKSAERPLAFPRIAARLVGTRLDDAAVKDAANAAAADRSRSDLHASAEYAGISPPSSRARAARSARKQKRVSDMLYTIAVEVNGKRRSGQVPARLSLVDWLRESSALPARTSACEHGICGACSVMLDGEPVRACLMYAVQANGHRVTTVEGLAKPDGSMSVLQDSFCETHGLQNAATAPPAC